MQHKLSYGHERKQSHPNCSPLPKNLDNPSQIFAGKSTFLSSPFLAPHLYNNQSKTIDG